MVRGSILGGGIDALPVMLQLEFLDLTLVPLLQSCARVVMIDAQPRDRVGIARRLIRRSLLLRPGRGV